MILASGSRLGLDAGFPSIAEEKFKASGVSPELARDFWAAHWQLPSPALAFEMFAREEIDESQLRDIFVANDFLPGLIDNIIAVAYNPLTRVDVRRMHALGIIDDAELERRYRMLGFSPDDASLMAQFTIAFNEEGDPNTAAETRELTRTQIVDFFEDGLFTRADAIASLVDIGYTEDNADSIIELAEIKVLRAQQKARVQVVKQRFENHAIDYNTALGQLDEIGLTSTERDLVAVQMEAQELANIKIPTRTELDKFFKEGLIDESIYLDQMAALGFATEWAEKFLALVQKGKAD
jgi:hypothetical protein